MKFNTSLLTLMIALAAGSAAAASPTGTAAGTTAGIGIKNTASATFTDPTNNSVPTVNSNTVTTTVNAVTGFDVLYQDGSTDDTSPTAPATSYDKADATPGSTVQTKYTVVNNSNIDNYVVNLAPVVSTANAAGGTASLATSDVQYFAVDANGAKTGAALSKVTLAVGGAQDIIQVITIPSTAKAGDKFSASPKGTAPASTDTAAYPTAPLAAFSQYDEASNTNGGVAPTNADLQYTRATVYTPNLNEIPPTPGTNTVVPPTPANPGTPDNPVSPPNTPPSTDPSKPDPSKPGYTSPDPTNPGTPTPPNVPGTAVFVDVAGNNQTAYPPSGVTQVAFSNQVKNGNTTTPDTVRLFPSDGTLGSASKAVPDTNGKFSYTTPGGDAVTVQFFGTNGQPLARDTNNYPVLPVAAGGTSLYFTVVTFPDQTIKADPTSIVIPVGVSSGNKVTSATPSADANTTDTILPPGLKFGDDVAGSPDATKIGPNNAAQVVKVNQAATTTPILDAGVNTDRTAVFPMDLFNSGEYADTYILESNTIDFQKVGGGVTTVPVKYYYNNGSVNLEITQKNSAGNYFTPVVAANTTLKVYAVIDVPTDALATNGTLTNTLNGMNGIDKDVTFNQKVTANYSGVVLTDTNDQITVLPVNTILANASGIVINKYQGVNAAPTINAAGQTNKTALPKDTLKYAIVVKNNFNAPVKNFVLKELDGGALSTTSNSINTYGAYQTVSVTGYSGFSGTPVAYYSVDGGTNWSSAAPALGTVTLAKGLQIYIDTDANQVPTTFAPTAGDVIPANATFQINIDVKVN